jgi:6-methylsalicylate decarboxylase
MADLMTHRIDLHHHIIPPRYVEVVGQEAFGSLTVTPGGPSWSVDKSLEVMDRHGIEIAVTAISAPGLVVPNAAGRRDLGRYCNEYATELRVKHPGRFGVFASLPLPDIDGSLAEIAYCIDVLKVDGFELMSNYGGVYPGDPAFAPVFDELNRRKALVHYHPNVVAYDWPQPEIPAATLEFPFDTSRAVVSLLYSGVLARCHDIKWVFSHAGGTVPFLADRIARAAARPQLKANVPNGVIPELERLYFDTALSANPRIFSALLLLVGTDRVLFGSDYPYAPEPTTAASIKGLAELALPADQLRAIERDNALRLLPGLLTK